MSTTEVLHLESGGADVESVDMRLEAAVIPVSVVDRAKAFYERLVWRRDADLRSENSGTEQSGEELPS